MFFKNSLIVIFLLANPVFAVTSQGKSNDVTSYSQFQCLSLVVGSAQNVGKLNKLRHKKPKNKKVKYAYLFGEKKVNDSIIKLINIHKKSKPAQFSYEKSIASAMNLYSAIKKTVAKDNQSFFIDCEKMYTKTYNECHSLLKNKKTASSCFNNSLKKQSSVFEDLLKKIIQL